MNARCARFRRGWTLGLFLFVSMTTAVPVSGWTTTEVVSPEPEMFGSFACSADFSDNRLLVGEFYGNLTGRVYEFVYNGGEWSFSQQIVPDPGQIEGEFGLDVAVDGDWAMIGASGESENAPHDGAVYFFHHDGFSWQQMQRLPNPCAVPDSGANFGYRVAIDDTLALVTARYSNTGDTLSGAAYLYTLEESTWTLRGRLIPEDECALLELGSSGAIYGTTCVVGAIGDNMQVGAVYVFDWQGGEIIQRQKITPDGCGIGAWFGGSLDFDGETIIVGAWAESLTEPFGGAAYLYEHTSDQTNPWQFVQRIVSTDLAEMDWFGADVAVREGHALVGVPWDDDNGDVSGALYVFDRDNDGVWHESEKITPEGSQVGDHFGMCTVAGSRADFAGSMMMDVGDMNGAGKGFVMMPESNAVEGEEISSIPSGFTMTSWPNPFNAQARVGITLPAQADVQLALYDVMGREVKCLYTGELREGRSEFTLDANQLSSGIYFLHAVVSDGTTYSQKVHVVR